MTVDCNQYLFLEARTTPHAGTWITAFPMAKILRCDGSQAYQTVDTYPIEWEVATVPLHPGDVILAHPEIEPHGKYDRLYIHAVASNRQAIDVAVTEAQDVGGRCEFSDINDGMPD